MIVLVLPSLNGWTFHISVICPAKTSAISLLLKPSHTMEFIFDKAESPCFTISKTSEYSIDKPDRASSDFSMLIILIFPAHSKIS
jgi:hypothetical protein